VLVPIFVLVVTVFWPFVLFLMIALSMLTLLNKLDGDGK
jgi:hypothetical protein